VTAPAHTISVLPSGLEGERSRSCFDFFLRVSATELSRFFNEHFWYHTVLQAGHSSTAVCHALVAVSSIHRTFKEETPSNRLDKSTVERIGSSLDDTSSKRLSPFNDLYAFGEYGMALNDLAQDMSKEGNCCIQETTLVCAVLFIIIEIIRENKLAALLHLDNGINIINQNLSQTTDDSSTPVADELVSIFSQLDLEASIYQGRRTPGMFNLAHSPNLGFNGREFLNLADASDHLNALIGLMLHFQHSFADDFRYGEVGDIPLEAFAQQKALLEQLSQWKDAFTHLPAQNESSRDNRRWLLLQIHHRYHLIVLQCCLHAEETAYDAFQKEFIEIVKLSEVLNASSLSEQNSFSGRTFSLENGIIRSLFWTVIKCRNAEVRRQALDQLQFCPQEGVWVAEIQSRIGKRVIEIEESVFVESETRNGQMKITKDGTVPEVYRVHNVDMTLYEHDRRIMMNYQRRLNGLDGEWDIVTEWLNY
jgi:transcription factor-like protein